MDNTARIKAIRDLIARNRIPQALTALQDLHAGNPEEDEVLLLISQNEGNSRDARLGLLSTSEANLAQNKLRAAMLGLTREPTPVTRGARRKTGDEVGRDKIERQINVNQGDYIENQTNYNSANERNAESPNEGSSTEKQKILFVTANPTDTGRLQTDVEHKIIKGEMQKGNKRDNFSFLPIQTAVGITELMRALKAKPEILHFAGHGKQEGIQISDDQNKALLLNDSTLKLLFKKLRGKTKLVLLNNCHSAHQAQLISSFGMYVIGHNWSVEDKAALSFAKGFYLGLSEGMSYEDAYTDGAIVVSAENRSSAVLTLEVWKDGEKLDW